MVSPVVPHGVVITWGALGILLEMLDFKSLQSIIKLYS